MEKKDRFLFDVRLAAWVEIIGFFLICMAIAYIARIDFNYFSYSPHPFWIIVILISAQYGTQAGLLAAFVATVLYLTGPLPKQSLIQENNEYIFLLLKIPLLWFVTALILGELRMKHIRERDRLMIIASTTTAREKQLADSYEALKRVKERLELHVASETPTALMIIQAFINFQKCEKDEIIPKACELINILIAPEKFSIYLLQSNKLVLVYAEKWEDDDHYAKSFSSNSPIFREIVDAKRIISLTTGDTDSLGAEGIIAAPILASPTSNVIGMIKIELMPFQQIKLATMESLRMIGLSIGEAYER